MPHQPAALSSVLTDFAGHDFKSRKNRTPSDTRQTVSHCFFVDFECGSLSEADTPIAALRARGGLVRDCLR